MPAARDFLGQADDVPLRLALGLHHQVADLVDDDDDVRHLLRNAFALLLVAAARGAWISSMPSSLYWAILRTRARLNRS